MSLNIYAIRISNKKNEYENHLKTAFECYGRVIGVSHTGKDRNQPHWHYVITTHLGISSVRKHLKNYFDGPRHVMVKAHKVEDTSTSYIMKEHKRDTFRIVMQKAYTDDEVAAMITRCDNIQEQMKANTTSKMCVDIYNEMTDDGYDKPNGKDIMKYIWRYCRTTEWYPNKFQTEKYIIKIQSMAIRDKRYYDKWAMDLYDAWFPGMNYMYPHPNDDNSIKNEYELNTLKGPFDTGRHAGRHG